MASIGPSLPPHLAAKRKRQGEPSETTPDAEPSTLKPQASRSPSATGSEKRRRVVGPAPPPAALDERPPRSPPSESDSSDEDDYGPAPASGNEPAQVDPSMSDQQSPSFNSDANFAEKRTERDAWMTMPPQQDDLAARMDPTKIRARKFNTGKGAKAPTQNAGGPSDMWTETPEQKRKRLENQVMGISSPSLAKPSETGQRVKMARDEETERRIQEHTERTRGKSLYEQHQAGKQKEKEDDPSKRAFDWEKDMGSGMKISRSQRNEMVNKASGFGSKFSKGSYL